MKILFRHKEIVPVKNYGGTERILWWLMKELVAEGHEVFLIGDPKSDLKEIGATLIADNGKKDWTRLIPKGVDVLHLFLTKDAESIKDIPKIVTIHGNGKPNETFDKNTVFLSKKHALNHNATCYVYNGVDLSKYPFRPKKTRGWNDFCFLAKARWSVKNLNDCVRACKQTKKNLTVAGGRTWSLSRYIRSLGFVNDAKKLELLRTSDALLFPVRWHEPFGVAVIEAYTQGLPVIGSSYGSLPELISKDTGIICRNYNDLVLALERKENGFDAEKIRAYADSNFSSKTMAKSYIELYKKVIGGAALNKTDPMYKEADHPETLLAF